MSTVITSILGTSAHTFHSDVLIDILDEMPPDPTDVENVIHSLLFLGKPTKVLTNALNLDPWLSAHLADLMEPLELIDPEPTE